MAPLSLKPIQKVSNVIVFSAVILKVMERIF